METLKQRDSEMSALKKKNTRLVREATKEGKSRVKAELDKKVLQDQVRGRVRARVPLRACGHRPHHGLHARPWDDCRWRR